MVNKKDNKKSSNFFKQVAASTPLIVGTGIFANRMFKEGAINPPKTPAITSAIHTANTNRPKKAPPMISSQKHLNFMRKHPNIAIEAWENAMNSMDPLSRKEVLSYAEDLSTLSESEVASSIENTMRESKSNLARKGHLRFIKNLEVFQKHLAATGTTDVPTFHEIQSMQPESVRRRLPERLGDYVKKIQKGLSADAKASVRFYERQGWKETGFGVYDILFKSSVGNFNLELPNIAGGALVEGIGQQTKRIAPTVSIFKDGKIIELSRTEFLLQEFEESILDDFQTGNIKTQSELKKATDELYQNVIRDMEAITNVPKGIEETKALKEYIETRGQATDIRIPVENRAPGKRAYRIPTNLERDKAVIAGKFFGGVGPDALAEGRVQKTDLAKRLMVPSAGDTSRRLEQPIRKWETLSGKSMEARTLYMDFDKYPEARKALNIGEGEIGVRQSWFEKAEKVQTNTKIDLKINRVAFDPNEILSQDFKPGQILGYEATTGAPVTYKSNMRMLGTSVHNTKSKGDFLRVHFMDTQKIGQGAKVFGLKATLLQMEEATAQRIIQQQLRRSGHASEIDMIADIKFQKKNQAIRTEQIVTGMYDSLKSPGRRDLNEAAKRFLSNPQRFATNWEGGALTNTLNKGTFYSQEEFVQRAWNYSLKAGLTSDEMDQVFSEDRNVGRAKLVFDDPAKHKGAGAMGSYEPRIHDVFANPIWGEEGKVMSEGIIRRQMLTNPEKVAVFDELSKSIQSYAGKMKRGAEKVFDVERSLEDPGSMSQKFRSFVDEGGGFIKPGRGLNEVYVPPAEVASVMREIKTATGNTSTSLFDDYMKVVNASSSMYSQVEPASLEEARLGMEKGLQSLVKQWGPAGKGMGAYTRGRTLGSKSSRAVSAIGKYIPETMEKRYKTEPEVISMVKEMRDMGEWTTSEAAERLNTLRKGGTITGMEVRHPNIGPFVSTPIEIGMARRERGIARIAVPEEYMNLGFQPGQGLDSTRVQIGPNVGKAADKDADNLITSFLSPDEEKIARRKMMSVEYKQKQIQHQLRYQLLSAGGQVGEDVGLSIEAKRIADMRKLSAATQFTANISTQMSEARRALLEHGRGQAAEDALTLIQFAEQNPISGKHKRLQDILGGNFEEEMISLGKGMQAGEKHGEREFMNMLQKSAPKGSIAARVLTKDILLDPETTDALGKHYGIQAESRIRSFNAPAAVAEIFRTQKEYRLSSGGAREANIVRGRAGKSIVETAEVVGKYAAQAAGVEGGVFSKVVKGAMAKSNILAAVGRSAIKNYKPLALGFGASLALAATLSSPRDTIGPGSALTNTRMNIPRSKAASRMRPETMMPEGQTLGSPTAPNMLRSKSVSIDSTSNYPQSRVTMRAPANTNMSSLAARIAGSTGQQGGINLNLKDDRSSLSPRVIAEKLFG